MSDAPKFATLLAAHYIERYIEKPLIGARFIRLSRLLTVGGFLFENGAVLGRAFRDRFDSFLVPFLTQAGRPEAAEWVIQQGESVGVVAPVANTVNELFMIHEMRISDPSLPPQDWSRWFMGSGKQKLNLDFALQMGGLYGARGAGFGAQFPDRFEELYNNSYGNIDPNEWREAHEAGLAIPVEPDKFVPLHEREQEAVSGFAEFCESLYPEYASGLGIRSRG